MLLGSLTSLVLLLSVNEPAPRLCVELEGQSPVDIPELLAAIRARIDRREVRVDPCESSAQSAFSVRAVFPGPDSVELQLQGPDVRAERTLFIGGLARQEVSQTIALTVVEAIRRPLDALLVRQGRAVPEAPPPMCAEPPPCPSCAEAPVCPAAEACPSCPACEVCPGPIEGPPALHFGLKLEPGIGLGDQGISAWFGLVGALAFGPLALAPHLGLDPLGRTDALQVINLELGLSGQVQLGILDLSLGLVGRAHWVTVRGTADADGGRLEWSPGFSLGAHLSLLTFSDLSLGLGLRAWAWPNPPRFRVDEQVIRAEPYAELAVFPTLAFRLF